MKTLKIILILVILAACEGQRKKIELKNSSWKFVDDKKSQSLARSNDVNNQSVIAVNSLLNEDTTTTENPEETEQTTTVATTTEEPSKNRDNFIGIPIFFYHLNLTEFKF
jgi:hypothetical protein